MITGKDFIKAVQDVVREQGKDFVYPEEEKLGVDQDDALCQYLYNGRGSCIFGRALLKLGVDEEFLADREGSGISTILPDVVSSGICPMANATIVQLRQDTGSTWGEAIKNTVFDFED